jgi:small subunit ribosomal protein S1
MTSQSIPSQEPTATFSHDDFAEALAQHDYHFERGQVVRGKVCEHASEGAYVDISGKSAGFVPIGELSAKPGANLVENLPIGAEMDFLIVKEQNAEGQVTLSRRLLEINQAWDKVTELAQNDQTVQLRVTRTNKGGVIGEVERLRGFIPRSHLIEKEDLESLVGQSLTANFLEVDRERNRLILSQRQVARSAAISKLEKASLQSGKIVKIQPYGLFVDLDGVTGLLHITQISNVRVEGLAEKFQIGQEIQVFVLDIDEYKNRVSLSTKILENYPGEILTDLAAVMATVEERAEQAKEKLAEAEAEAAKD